MSRILLIRPEAEQDLSNARDWYEARRAGLGLEFLIEVAFTLKEIESNPTRDRLYYREFRRTLLTRFPYKVFFQVFPERIVIFRVLHAKQEHSSTLRRP
jgi:plasmid stabilization system protein ParE